jgi:hypothetical protein
LAVPERVGDEDETRELPDGSAKGLISELMTVVIMIPAAASGGDE